MLNASININSDRISGPGMSIDQTMYKVTKHLENTIHIIDKILLMSYPRKNLIKIMIHNTKYDN